MTATLMANRKHRQQACAKKSKLVKAALASLTEDQIQRIDKAETLRRRLNFVAALHAKNGKRYTYTLIGTCKTCGDSVSPLQIMDSFDEESAQSKIQCKHGHSVQADFSFSDGIKIDSGPLYSKAWTLKGLRDFKASSPQKLRDWQGNLYHGAIIHCGTLRNAFAQIGIEYQFSEAFSADIGMRIKPFLGVLFDRVIAEMSGLTLKTIKKMRKQFGVGHCERARIRRAGLRRLVVVVLP